MYDSRVEHERTAAPGGTPTAPPGVTPAGPPTGAPAVAPPVPPPAAPPLPPAVAPSPSAGIALPPAAAPPLPPFAPPVPPAAVPQPPTAPPPPTDGTRPGSDGEHALQQRLGTAERADRFYQEQVLDHLNPRMREFIARQEMFFLATADRHGECDSTFRAGPPGFLQVFDDRTLAYPEYRGNGVLASLGNIEENPHVGILLIDFLRDRIGLHVNGTARLVEDDRMRALHPGLPVDPVPGRRAVIWVEVRVEEAYIHCAKHIPRLAKAVPRQSRGADRRHARPPAPEPEERPGQHPAPEPGGRAGEHPAPEPGGFPARPPGRSPEPERHPAAERDLGHDQPANGEESPRRTDQDWGTDDVRRKGGDFFGAAAEAGRRGPRRTPARSRPDANESARWRQEAERALARARQREADAAAPFTGWFG